VTGAGLLFMIVAIAANVTANLLLKRAMGGIDGARPLEALVHFLTSWTAWAGIASAGILFVSYLMAIRTLPLAPTYAAVTATTIALLTAWGLTLGGEAFSLPKLLGILAIAVGFVLIVVPFDRV